MYSLKKEEVAGFNCFYMLLLTGSPLNKCKPVKSETYFM